VGLRVFGRTYCAAPILGQENSTAGVQFWAVGLDCCGARGRFDCDSASDASVRGGVVVHAPLEGEEAASRSLLAPRIFHEGYLRAVAASCSLYALQQAESPVFLRWTASSDSVLVPWLVSALVVWLGSSLVYCALLAMVWRASAWGKGRSATLI